MKYLRTSLCLLLISSGCTSNGSPTGPQSTSRPGPASPAPPGYTQIAVGQVVTAALKGNGAQHHFELTALSNGTLTVTVSWDNRDGIVELRLGSKQFGYELGNPLTGRVTVVAGQKYLVTIADAAPWDYHGLHLPYTFKSSIDF